MRRPSGESGVDSGVEMRELLLRLVARGLQNVDAQIDGGALRQRRALEGGLIAERRLETVREPLRIVAPHMRRRVVERCAFVTRAFLLGEGRGRMPLAVEKPGDRLKAQAARFAQGAQQDCAWRLLAHDMRRGGALAQRVEDERGDLRAILGAGETMADAPFLQHVLRRTAPLADELQNLDGGGKMGGGGHGGFRGRGAASSHGRPGIATEARMSRSFIMTRLLARLWKGSAATCAEPSFDPADFARKAEHLAAMTASFGYDPKKARLVDEEFSFELAGLRCKAEGRALPDGSILVFYDPQMTLARLACCVAHEVQHQKYARVRRAYGAEGADGPMHEIFAAFTPERLAERQGVSDYSNEHWAGWRAAEPPRLFEDEMARGGSEPINETLAEVAKALYNFGREARIDPLWRALYELILREWARIEGRAN